VGLVSILAVSAAIVGAVQRTSKPSIPTAAASVSA
jgi:hypothetical protein